jgi:hypothetical protein
MLAASRTVDEGHRSLDALSGQSKVCDGFAKALGIREFQ